MTATPPPPDLASREQKPTLTYPEHSSHIDAQIYKHSSSSRRVLTDRPCCTVFLIPCLDLHSPSQSYFGSATLCFLRFIGTSLIDFFCHSFNHGLRFHFHHQRMTMTNEHPHPSLTGTSSCFPSRSARVLTSTLPHPESRTSCLPSLLSLHSRLPS